MQKIFKLVLVGCATAPLLALGACSSDGAFRGGLALGSSQSIGPADDGDGSSGSGSGGSGSGTGSGSGSGGSGSGSVGTGGSGTGGGGVTPGGGAGSSGSPGGGSTGGGSGTNSVNTGGAANNNGAGTIGRVSDLAGDLAGGAVIAAGNAVLTGGAALGPLLTSTGRQLGQDGLGGLPVVGDTVDAVVHSADAGLNGAAKVTLANHTVIGSGAANSTQLAGVSALSNATTPGQVVTVGVLNGSGATQLASVNVGGTQLLGSSGSPALVGAGVLAPTQSAGTVATVGVLPGASGPLAAVTPLVTSTTSTVGGLVTGLTGGASTGGAGLILVGGAGGAATLGPATAVGGLLGGLSVRTGN